MSNFTPFIYVNDFTDYGNGFDPGGWMQKGDHVFFRGAIVLPQQEGEMVFATLPFSIQANQLVPIAGLSAPTGGSNPTFVRVSTSGDVSIGGGFQNSVGSLDGISFFIA